MLTDLHSSAVSVADAGPLKSSTKALSPNIPLGGYSKRAFDLTVAAVSMVVLAPLLIFIALFVKLSGEGPIFYRHTRVGHRGKPFACLKFRTMVVDGDKIIAMHLAACPEARAEWLATRKLRRDPRVTALGSVLRKSSLDELPQLLNILRGEMSLVGPRPVVCDELKLYGVDAKYYLSARPGLTGQWQISGRSNVVYDARVNFDRSYVEGWSLFRDMAIIIKTVPAVVKARGSC